MLFKEIGWLEVLVMAIIVQGAFYLFDLYDLNRIRKRPMLLLAILQAVGLASIGMAVVFYLAPAIRLGRGAFMISLWLMVLVMASWRLVAMWLIEHPRLAERVLILGVGANAVTIAREVLKRRELGYEVIGFVGEDPVLLGKSLINPRVVGLYSQ